MIIHILSLSYNRLPRVFRRKKKSRKREGLHGKEKLDKHESFCKVRYLRTSEDKTDECLHELACFLYTHNRQLTTSVAIGRQATNNEARDSSPI